jgi:hypothetical protein
MKRLVLAGSSDEAIDGLDDMVTSGEVNIVTVTTEDIVALAASTVAQLTGEGARRRRGSDWRVRDVLRTQAVVIVVLFTCSRDAFKF